jgi:hypothetical protein
MPTYPNQYAVPALPYTHEGALTRDDSSNQNPEILWPGGENTYLITGLSPGQTVAAHITTVSYPDGAEPIRLALAFYDYADPGPYPYYGDLFPVLDVGESASFSVVVPAGVTSMRLGIGWDGNDAGANTYEVTISLVPDGPRCRYRVLP